MEINMRPEYDNGDILIRRVRNGWLLVTGNETAEGEVDMFVYEDEDCKGWVEKSLYKLLIDQFDCYMQNNQDPGIKVSFSDLSFTRTCSTFAIRRSPQGRIVNHVADPGF